MISIHDMFISVYRMQIYNIFCSYKNKFDYLHFLGFIFGYVLGFLFYFLGDAWLRQARAIRVHRHRPTSSDPLSTIPIAPDGVREVAI